MEPVIASSLCRFRITDEHLITDKIVKEHIARAFAENRCYEFYLDRDVVGSIRAGEPVELYRERFIDMRNSAFDIVSKGDQTVRGRLMSDIRLSSRLITSFVFAHRATAEADFDTIMARRFVIVKELPGVPTIFHISPETTVISHVGQGPPWTEIPTIYLGLKIFDALTAEQKRGAGVKLFGAFKLLLMIEERAIQTGYNHSVVYPPAVSRSLNFLVDETLRNAQQFEIEEAPGEVVEKRVRKFSEASRAKYLRELDARVHGDILNFHYERNLEAVKSLERLARRYKMAGDAASLREIVRLLVAASGHDIHEIRNRANIVLERIFAPKEFDAPLATRFANVPVGQAYRFTFEIPGAPVMYHLRIYRNSTGENIFLEKDIDCIEIPLVHEGGEQYAAEYIFDRYGHYDFTVILKKRKNAAWVTLPGLSGRINAMPDIRGEIILEIFADIHGHTRTYWTDGNGHPGLVYNENGEVIRLGRFADVTAHLEDIKKTYSVTTIYLLGVQKRGRNHDDWAPNATSPSPFSPMSLVDIEPALGGEEELKELIGKCHRMDIKVIVDIIPHINRSSDHLSDAFAVRTYDDGGNLVVRASTDGRYGSWNDGKLLNYRMFEVWEWLSDSITSLVERFDIDGIRFDSAHAVPIMMKKNNFPFVFERKRELAEMVEGTIIVNDREDDHYVTTGYYDSACRDLIAVPLHFFLMLNVEKKMRQLKKEFFINVAECYWGHERFLTRTGLIPYNSSLFKICENIIHGKTDVREIYHIYDSYFPSALPEGTEMLGILGNHDERRALNTFGHRGLRAAVGLTCFMSSAIMDYEGSAEGEGWKVYLDNIYVNWNQFEYAAHRSLQPFYGEWYRFHREERGKGYLIWANNTMVAAAAKFVGEEIWLGVFNFADANQNASLQFDSPVLPIPRDRCYRLSDPLYSNLTGHYNYYTGRELAISHVNTVVSFTERVKLLRLEPVDPAEYYHDFLRDSFFRLCQMSNVQQIQSNFAYEEMAKNCGTYEAITAFIKEHLVPVFFKEHRDMIDLGLKRGAFYLVRSGILNGRTALEYARKMSLDTDLALAAIGRDLIEHNRRGALVFMSAEAEPFSKSGGLANVVYELPRELVKLGEEVFVISGYYRHGDDKSVRKMQDAAKKYNLTYTGVNVSFKIMGDDYQVGVHHADVEGIHYYLLDHHEFFDGLYWGVTSVEKIRRRVAFSRACVEVITAFNLNPSYTFTNDAYAGIFNGIVKCDHFYLNSPAFGRNTFLHIVHNGGWQYFDAYHRMENGFDLFNLFNLPTWNAGDFCDPVYPERLNCMAAGIRFADRVITVSPSYARQIEYACDGLERILKNVIGISNAIGSDFKVNLIKRFEASRFVAGAYPLFAEHVKSDDALRAKLEERYPELLGGQNGVEAVADKSRQAMLMRLRNKLYLQCARGLKVDPDIVLFSYIHRVSEQKGYQLLLEASEGIFKNLKFQGVIGGAVSSGDRRGEEIAHGLYLLGQYYPDMVNVSLGFQDITAPLLASDLFLMPSMHEPGGISQLEAFAAGNLVVARATGGLRDTVFPVQVQGNEIKGNGFLFTDFNSWAFYDAMDRALQFFRQNSEDVIHRVRTNAERSVYYWDRPAREYVETIYTVTETIRVLE
ncbi:MAG: glycogen/starch synthase [Spirochaetes bacterium]|nr:glycogen/starch synthase [Spirochaetota bacterium]